MRKKKKSKGQNFDGGRRMNNSEIRKNKNNELFGV